MGLLPFASAVGQSSAFVHPDYYRIMFYNVENLFDYTDDPETNDDEFLPHGERHWTRARFSEKLQRIARVIVSLGEWSPPVMVGLCEIENQFVLDRLLSETHLGQLGYRVVHKESPDWRGIDIALLYRNDLFLPVAYRAIQVTDPADPEFKTRDILYVKGLIGTDTLHLFVNHWPSKYGGVAESEPRRFLAARILKQYSDSLLHLCRGAKVLIMGDFNDTPEDPSVSHELGALPYEKESVADTLLYNLAWSLAHMGKGSYKYQSQWFLIDQILVAGGLLNSETDGLITSPTDFHIFGPAFLLEKDQTHLGMKPFRTYSGFNFHNGFSDHLPVYLDLKLNSQQH